MNTFLKSLSLGLIALAFAGLGLVSSTEAQTPAGGSAPANPAPAGDSYTQIDVNYRSAVGDKMHFAGGPATLTAAATLCDVPFSVHVSIEVESGKMTRGEATEALADAIRDAIPGGDTEVCVAGSTIIVKPTCLEEPFGSGDKPHDWPNDGDKVNPNMPGSSQFDGN